ncbi:MAG: Glu/Leu/Phe/Val dehydrogenase dimerization domain-containing protein [Nitrospinota bacterium]
MEVRIIRRLGHEHIAAFHEPDAGLVAYIAIHSTRLGPALGGVRMWPYPNEEEALEDVLHLSRAMTYKAALAGLPLGGGKSVIVGDSARDKSPALWEAFGRCVESLGGRYTAAEDVGTTPEDMDAIARVSRHVVGTSTARGGTGDPASHTARGVLAGIRVALKWRFGGEGLSGCRVAIQGVGAVGMELAAALFRAGARLIVSDVREDRVGEATRRFRAWRARPEGIHRAECEVFAPCALGGALDERTVGELRCAMVVGSANNQLASPEAGERLARRGILYAPDYLVNAGGLVAVAAPLVGLSPAQRDAKVVGVAERLLQVFRRAEREEVRPEEAADRQAEEALRSAPAGRPGPASWLPREARKGSSARSEHPTHRGARRTSGASA